MPKKKIPQYVLTKKTEQVNEKEDKNRHDFWISNSVSFIFFLTALFIAVTFIPIKIKISINKRPYEGQPVNKEDVTVKAFSLSGNEIILQDEWYSYNFDSYRDVGRIKTSFLYLNDEHVFDMMPYSRIKADYCRTVYPGDMVQKKDVKAWLCYYNGKKRELNDFSLVDAPERFGKEASYIRVQAGEFFDVIKVKPVKILDTKASYQPVLHQYDALELKGLKVIYNNGKTADIPVDKITYITDKDKMTELLGLNEVEVEYLGVRYKFDVKTIINTNVSSALRDYAEEIADADYLHQTDSCIIAIKKYKTDLGTYFLSHVIINDPSQITGQLSHGDWGGDREKPSAAAERLGLILATNASYFSYDTGNPSTSDVIIKDKKIYSDGETCGKEICLMKDGSLYSPKEGLTADDLLDMGAVTTWAAGDPLLIQEGKLLSTQHDWVNGKYPRTAIGMIKPCDYYILTAGSGAYKGGLTFDDVQAIYNDLGCQYARTFDGGGSSTLAFDDGSGVKVLNTPAGKTERPVADIFGIMD